MMAPRVQRSAGPRAKMTEATYRKKALPFLLKDFDGCCAYCLDPGEFRSPSQSQVDHFDCKLSGRKRNQYFNLMLACAACNLSKHDKPIVNPLNKEQRLLDCTKENEFPNHIVEAEDGRWEPKSEAGIYHLASIGLQERCHRQKRHARRVMAERVLKLCTTAIEYQTCNPEAVHNEIMDAVRDILRHLENFPPLVTSGGVVTVREWLKLQGVDFDGSRPIVGL